MLVYQPAEDSYLMQNVLETKIPILLKRNPCLSVLEVGSGSGIQLQKIKELGVKNILSCDVNSDAVKECKRIGFNCVNSNLFSNIKDKYDIIIFNPPYLPENIDEPQDSRIATTGGKFGSEVINKFLFQAKKHLKSNGKIFLLTSNLTKKINWQNFKKKKIAEKKLFFEKLFVWELRL